VRGLHVLTTQSTPTPTRPTISRAERELTLGLRSRVHHALVKALETSGVPDDRAGDRQYLLERARAVLSQLISEERGILLPQRLREVVAREAVDEVVGFGPLQPLLEDPSVTEILVNGPEETFVERAGQFERADIVFDDGEHVVRIVQRILGPVGRRLDERSPMVDARLPDGSRLNAVIRPVAVAGPLVTIRKHGEAPFGVDRLLEVGTLSRPLWRFLKAAVKAKLNIVISGGPGSGKTTLLRVLAGAIPQGERVVIMEDSAELMIDRRNFVSMESRPATAEGVTEITIGDLVRNALRMRPDRIIVGEVRGKEAFDMLQALNTGTEGSLSTLHSNSPEDALIRLESMCMMAGLELSSQAISRQIGSAVHLIVQQSRLPDGSRKITHLAEVVPRPGELPGLRNVFTFRHTGADSDGNVTGRHEYVGTDLLCAERLRRAGVNLEQLLSTAEDTDSKPEPTASS